MFKQSGNIFSHPITRREMLKLMGSASIAGTMGLPLSNIDRAHAGILADRPNIVFILSDNCRWDTMGFMGHPFIQTPGMDQLAKDGLVFRNAFHPTPLCSPSRASILTGTYAHTHGVLNNHTPWTGQKTTFLEYMKNAGYDTAFVGKWHMPGKGLPDMPYLDQFVSYTYREGQGSYYNCPLVVNGKTVPPTGKYITEEVTDYAIDFIQKNQSQPDGKRNPFCVYLSHRTAHPPFISPKGIKGMYSKEKISLPGEIDSWFSRTNGNVFQGIMMGSYENQYRKYCETITAMDRDIERLVDTIDEMGLKENTVVIYAGDDGMLWGEHRCHGIREPYEPSIRTPFIVRAPSLTNDKSGNRDQMILNIDIAPTLLDIAGVSIPSDMEGESILPVIQNKVAAGRKAWLLEFWKYFPENTPSYVGVRTEQYKYVEYERGRNPELFDLLADPEEKRNLYNTSEGLKLVPDLKELLVQLKSGKKIV